LKEVTHLRNEKIEPRGTDARPYLSLEHIESGTNRIINYGSSEEVKSTKTVFYSGDVLYGKLRPYLNKVCQPEVDGVCSADILVFAPSPAIESGFLMRFLSREETVEYANMHSKGINLPRLSARQLGEMEVNLPPLAEQNRIVARIEQLQAHSRQAREALEGVPALLEQLRQSILAAAFRGDLTKQWRQQHPEVEPASELLKRIRTERRRRWESSELKKLKARGLSGNQLDAEFAKRRKQYQEPQPVGATDLPELPEGWCWAAIEEIAECALGKMLDRQKNTIGSKFPYLRNLNVRWGSFDTNDLLEMFFKEHEIHRYSIVTGDVVVCEGGEPGRAAVWEGEEAAMYQKALHRIRPSLGISPWLIVYHLWHDAMLGNLERFFTGTTIKHFTGKSLQRYPLCIPPVDEQREVVLQIGEHLKRIVGMLENTELAGDQLSELDNSILSKAFRGELVPQDPDDEPASVLLERIRNEKVRQTKEVEKTKGWGVS